MTSANLVDSRAPSLTPDAHEGSGRLTRILILGSVLLGAWLRIAWLGDQIVVGDEIHPIRATAGSFTHILTTYPPTDSCIPISVWCKLLSVTVGLEEWGLRALALLPGIVLVWLGARATARIMAPPEKLLLTLLLACSPLLVFWSRTGRPYSAIALLGVLAVLTMLRFGEHRTLRWCVACAACQFGLFLFSPTTVPALAGLNLAAVVWGLQAGAVGPSRWSRLALPLRMMLPGFLAVLITLASLALALPSLFELLGAKNHGGVPVSGVPLIQSAQVVYGLPRSHLPHRQLLLILPIAATLLGLLRFCFTYRRLALPGCLFLFASPVLYMLTEFTGLGYAQVFVRYQAVTIPFYLFFLAYGAGGVLLFLGRYSLHLGRAGLVVAISLVAILAAFGPLRSGLGPRVPFGLLFSRLFEPWPLEEVAMTGHLSDFYHQLDAIEDLTLYECYATSTRVGRQVAATQQLHGGRVIRCCSPLDMGGNGMRFKTLRVDLETVGAEMSRGAYLVLHGYLKAELEYFNGGPRPQAKPARQSGAALGVFSEKRCREVFGEPVFVDELITVFGSHHEENPTFRQYDPGAGTEPAELSNAPLVLEVTPEVVAPGEVITFETSAGIPGENLVVTLVARNGEPIHVEITSGLVVAAGVWKRSLRIPHPSPTLTLSFELTGDRHGAAGSAENRVQVIVRE